MALGDSPGQTEGVISKVHFEATTLVLQQGDALSLFMDGSLSREQNTVGDPDHFGDDSNDKPSQAKGVSRLVIYLSPSDGYPLLPYLA